MTDLAFLLEELDALQLSAARMDTPAQVIALYYEYVEYLKARVQREVDQCDAEHEKMRLEQPVYAKGTWPGCV
jgi:alpha-galactosidase